MDAEQTARKIALRIRERHLLNVALAAIAGKEGDLREACDLAEQAIATALREAAAPAWRPMAEAPRDGKDAFLLLTNTGVAWTGAWDGLQHCWRSIDGGQLVVTHFMPLPPLPSPPAQGGPA